MEDINLNKHLNIMYENGHNSESIKNMLINEVSIEKKDLIFIEITREKTKNKNYITKILENLYDEMEKRYKIFWKSNIRAFSEYNIKNSEKLNTIILVLIDCIEHIIEQKAHEEIIVKLLQKSNQTGIHIWNIETNRNNLFKRWMIEEVVIK